MRHAYFCLFERWKIDLDKFSSCKVLWRCSIKSRQLGLVLLQSICFFSRTARGWVLCEFSFEPVCQDAISSPSHEFYIVLCFFFWVYCQLNNSWQFCQVASGPIDCPPWHYGYTFRRKAEEWHATSNFGFHFNSFSCWSPKRVHPRWVAVHFCISLGQFSQVWTLDAQIKKMKGISKNFKRIGNSD